MTDQPAHAELGASSADRWIQCPGSVLLSRGMPDHSSPYAAEGTVAHTLSEICLADDSDPADHIGEAVDDNHPDIEVDEDMADSAREYVDLVRFLSETCSQTWIEARVRVTSGPNALSWMANLLDLDGEPEPETDMFGTADCLGLQNARTGLWLHVVDFKHGKGVAVDVCGNRQLRYYAVGGVEKLMAEGVIDNPADLAGVVIHIVQPRAGHPDGPVRSETVDMDGLAQFARELGRAANAALREDAPLMAGSHCRFCRAAGACPELARANLEKAKMVFSDPDDGGGLSAPTPPQELSLDEIRQILDAVPEIQQWLNAVQELAHARLESQEISPGDLGYKLVEKRATRRWRDPNEAADRLCEVFGLGDDQLYESKMRSPAQVEKALGKEAIKEHKDELSELIVKQSSGTTLASVDDARPDAGPRSASDAFEAQ